MGTNVTSRNLIVMGKGADSSTVGGVDYLNVLVNRKTKEMTADATEKKTELPKEIEATVRGDTVYHHRWRSIVYFFYAFGTYLILSTVLSGAVSPPMFVLLLAVNFFYYDVFSGVLHIVLDEPQHINHFPHNIILGPAALEFQWHHHIPHDIVSKPFVEVCGDLNIVVAGVAALYYLYGSFETPVGRCFCGLKLLAAYYGQFCHMQAHNPAGRRPAWVQWAQDHRLMISGEDHMVHHRNYDQNFCIGSGLSNAYFMKVVKLLGTDPTMWRNIFYAMLAVDTPIMLYMIQHSVMPLIG